jgi:hypothetical protein
MDVDYNFALGLTEKLTNERLPPDGDQCDRKPPRLKRRR